MKRYSISAGTVLLRTTWSDPPVTRKGFRNESFDAAWEQITTTKRVTYDDADRKNELETGEVYVFALEKPKRGTHWTYIRVLCENVQISIHSSPNDTHWTDAQGT